MRPSEIRETTLLLGGQGRFGRCLRQHRYLCISVVAHVCVGVALYYVGGYRPEQNRVRQQIEAGRQLTNQVRLERRVQDMVTIKTLLERSAPGALPTAGGKPVADTPVRFGATSLPTPPPELLKQARQLSEQIDRLGRGLPSARMPKPAGQGKVVPTAAPAQIERMEARARAMLQQRLQQLQSPGQTGRVEDKAGQQEAQGQGKRGQDGTHAHAGEQTAAAAPMVEQIAEFLNDRDSAHAGGAPKDGLAQRDSKLYQQEGLWIFGRGSGRIPAIDRAATVLGSGRSIGAGGVYANRIFINGWYVIGPFDGKHGKALFSNYSYPPEQGVALDAAYVGKDGRLLKWEYVASRSYPLQMPVFSEDAVYYGYTEVMMDRARDLTLWIGADDDAQIWLNDRLIWRGGNTDKAWFWREIYGTDNSYVQDFNLTEGRLAMHFQKGRNKIFFKLANGPSRLFFSLVLTE